MKTLIYILHSVNIIAGAAVAAGYAEKWLGAVVVASAGLDTYFTMQIPKAP